MPIIGQIGPLELLLVLALALLILGPGKLPEVGAAFGRTIREFRKASTEVSDAVHPPATPVARTTPSAADPVDPAPAAEGSQSSTTGA